MAGFIFIRSRSHAVIVARIYGALIAIPAVLAFTAEAYNYAIRAKTAGEIPPPIDILISVGIAAVGYKVGQRRSRTLACTVAILLGLALIVTVIYGYRHRVVDSSWLIALSVTFLIAAYGTAATIAYVRLADDNPYDLNHLQILQKMKTIVSVTMSSCCCLLLGLGASFLLRRFHTERNSLFAIGIMALFVAAFLDPLLHGIAHFSHLFRIEVITQSWYTRVLGVLGLSVIATVLHAGLEKGIERIATIRSLPIALLLVMLFLPGQLTGAWINGSPSKESAWRGFTRGSMLGLLSVGILWVIVSNSAPVGTSMNPDFFRYLRFVYQESRGDTLSPLHLRIDDPDTPSSQAWKNLAVTNAIIWGTLGMVGGIAVDRRQRWYGILLLLLMATVVIDIPLFIFNSQRREDLLGVGAAQLCLVVGWALGILLYPPASKLLLRDKRGEKTAGFCDKSG